MAMILDSRAEPRDTNDSHDDSTVLRGRQLRAARALWLILVAIAIVTFVVAVPARYAELTSVAPQSARPPQQLSPVEAQLLEDARISQVAYALALLALEIMFQLVFTALGLLIFVRESKNWVALFISLGLITYATSAAPVMDAIPQSDVAWALLGRFVQTLGLQIALMFFYIFPNGRFAPRWTLALSVGWAIVLWSVFFFPSLPWNFLNPWALLSVPFVFLMAWWGTGLLAQFVRLYREPSPPRRQQTKWVVYSATLAVIGYAVSFLPRLFWPDLRESGAPGLIYNLLAMPLFYLSVLMIPFAMAFSILRYRLWDIDRLIGRTLIYGMFSLALVFIYTGAILLLQQLIRVILMTERSSVPAVVLSTIGVAWLAEPLRKRIQAIVDRRFFRAKYDAERTVEDFGKTARDTVDLSELTARLTDVVNTTLQPSQVSIWIRNKDAGVARPSATRRS